MVEQQHGFIASHYASRAQDYVSSVVHATGDDLIQIENDLRGRGYGGVLDLGCGGGHVSFCAAPLVGEVVACDITSEMLEAVRASAAERGLSNIGVRQGAAENLPFEGAQFDAVLCRFSAHHWPSMEAGLREARRVLKPAGRAIFIDVVAPPAAVLDTHLQAVELLRDPSHVRNYSLAEWMAALARSGFGVETITQRRLRMDFPVWIARTRTPPQQVEAIRTLQVGAPTVVHDHFSIGPDGGFDVESVTFVANAG